MDQGPVAAIPDCEQCHSKPAMVSLSVIVIPPIPDVFSLQPFQLNCILSMMQLTHPQSTRQIRARHCHPPLVSHVERMVMVSFPVLFMPPPPPFKTFSHSFFFQLNCYPGRHARHHLSVDKANKSPSLPPPTCVPHGEGSDGEFFFHF